MSTNELDNVPPDDAAGIQEIPDPLQIPHQHPTNEPQAIIDNDESKSIDPIEDTSEDEYMSTRRSRELKQLLALSKEAKLDTNISYKRKSIETFKMKEYVASKPPEGGMVVKKYKLDKFPVTADSELEIESVSSAEMVVPEKIKNDEVKTREVVVGEERKSMKDCKPFKPNKDIFCWRCHREGVTICCETCPRSYHQKCLRQTITDTEHWPCPECVAILKAENTQTRSTAMKGMTLEHLCSLLKFACKRMIECNGSEPFMHDVNEKDFPDYKKYIIQPMTLTSLDKNIKENLYGSTQAFEADAKWILHNSIIFNSYQSKLTSFAKTILKICKQEMAEIENCPSCYLNANTKKNTWFVEVCPKPHILVWAKLKGFPYWPAKAMCTNTTGMVDVRFFGAHDRAWVPSRECFLYSRKDPNSNKQKRNDIIECMREVEVYISNIKALYGEFNYAPFKLPYDPDNELKQLLLFIPRYKPNAPPPRRRSRPPESRAKSVKKDDIDENDENEKFETKDTTLGFDVDMETAGNDSLITDESFLTMDKDLDVSTDKGKEMCVEISDNQKHEESIDSELNDDNQPLSRLAEGKLIRGNIRTRGGLNNSPDFQSNFLQGKLKTIPRRASEDAILQKKLSLNEIFSKNEITNTSSEKSITSETGISLNSMGSSSEIDIMETSGKTSDTQISSSTNNDFEKKRSAPQDEENSDNSISPSSKIKITDRLMKKLSKSEEDISKSTDEPTQVKSQTDILLEQYKNLVQEKSGQFSDIETPTAFGSTSINSETQCESGKEGEKMVTDEGNDVKLEDEKDNVDSDVVITLVENLQQENKNEEKNENLSEIFCDGDVGQEKTEKMPFKSDEVISNTENESGKKHPKADDLVERKTNYNESAPAKISKNSEEKTELPKKENLRRSSSDKEDKTETSKRIEKNATKDESMEEVPKDSKKEKKRDRIIVKITPKRVDRRLEKIKDDKQENKKPELIVVKTTPTAAKIEKTEFNSQKEIHKTYMKTKVDSKTQQKNKSEEKKIAPIQDSDVKTQTKTKPASSNDKKETQFVEQLDSNSSDDLNMPLDETQIDETNIINIIHSSLSNKEDKTPKRRLEETSVENNENGENAAKNGNVSKKPKLVTDDTNHDVEESGFKIIPIQTILNKKIDSDQSTSPETPILRNKLSQPNASKEKDSSMETVEIKSEPESCDDEMEETEYMEKKRKYLSALNISERGLAVKRSDVKTRSKDGTTRVGHRYLDNLSKVIDEVATTFSAKHEASKKTDKKTTSNHQMNVRKLAALQENGEIFVKSFAKLPAASQQQQQQPQQQPVRATPQKPLHKSKPSNTFTLKVPPPTRKEQPQKTNDIVPTTTLQRVTAPPTTLTTNPQSVPVSTASCNKTIESIASSGNVLILTQPGVILPTSQQLALNTGGFVTFVPSQQNMTMMQTPQVINAMMATGLQQNDNVQQPLQPPAETHSSQNYLPQNEHEQRPMETNAIPQVRTPATETNRPTVHTDIPSLIPINAPSPSRNNAVPTSTLIDSTRHEGNDDEFSLLNSLVPENVSRAISEVLCRPPPKLRPRPPGPLSQTFDTGNPSSAGPVSARINSVSHRLSDYMRGMLIETLEDLGKANNSEATVVSLKLELETLQSKHAVEMMDLRKNMCTILKDIQTSITEEKERVINETRSACEVEALRRIEEAKSKQWCACCGKEAQFYCCWNTSYCDYPCQQKHWSKHMNKCTQHAGQSQPSQNSIVRPQSQITFRPATPKTFAGRVVGKPTKVYLNRSANAKNVPTFKASTGGHVALLDTSNLEFLTGSSAKFIATSSFLTKVKTVNSTVTSPSNSIQQTVPNKKINSQTVQLSSSNKNTSNVISDEDAESE